MQISSFKLIDDGYSGVKITSRESIPQGNMTIIDDVTRTRRFPMPEETIKNIQKLKYFFLNLSGHWIEIFNKSFDLQEYKILNLPEGQEPTSSYLLLQSLMNHTRITGINLKNAGFCMTGTIETVEGKKMNVTTPFVTEEDDVSFFLEATDKLNHILDDIAGYMKSTKAIEFNAKEVLSHKGIKVENIESMDKDEIADIAVNRLIEMGFIVIGGDSMNEIGPAADKLHTGTKSIDSHKLPESPEHKEDNEPEHKEDIGHVPGPEQDEQIIIKDKADIGKGSMTSGKNFPTVSEDGKVIPGKKSDINPEGGNLADLEYSENLGMAGEKGAGLESDMNNDDKGEW